MRHAAWKLRRDDFGQSDNAFVALHNFGGLVAGDTASFNQGIDGNGAGGGVVQHRAATCALPRRNATATKHCDGVDTLVSSERRCLRPKDTFEECDDCPEMVVVPAGEFMMGLPDDRGRSWLGWPFSGPGDVERPQHKVRIAQSLAIGKFQVTRGNYEAFIAQTALQRAAQLYYRYESPGKGLVPDPWFRAGRQPPGRMRELG
jgi:formylglycine-generating enzyme required for sulfatase activity